MIMPMPLLPSDLSQLSLSEIAQMAADQRLPPVEQWNPPLTGDSKMRIARDGRWYHEGTLITRETMVRLFASILRKEPDGTYVVVTPVEKQTVDVEDAPFVAVEAKTSGTGVDRVIAFRLNTGDLITVDHLHPIHVAQRDGEPAPYVAARGGMDALVARAVYYELANLALDEGASPIGLWSSGTYFSLEPAA
jgi:uncharacterized protein